MIIYNVTVTTDHSITEAWVKWMTDEHVPELMQTGLFTGYKICHLLEQDETEGVTYATQYYCKDMADYQTYITQYAPLMREKGFSRFGNKFIAFRTVMEVVSQH